MSGQQCENYDVKQETVHCYPRNVDRCCTSFVKFSTGLTHLLCYITNHLMTGPSGNSEFCFPRISMFPSTSSRETMRFSGSKIHCSPRDQSLSVYSVLRILVDFSFVSQHFGSSNLCWLKSFFSAKINLNTAQSFSTTRKTVVKKAA